MIRCILGPTGSGKSGLGIKVAKKINGAIISCDSVQVYKGFDIGSGKVREEEKEGIPHYLLDLLPATTKFTVGDFLLEIEKALDEIKKIGKTPIIVGGTGLYYKAFAYQYGLNAPKQDLVYRAQLEELRQEKGNEFLYAKLLEVDPKGGAKIHPNHTTRLLRALEVYKVTGKSILEQEEASMGLRGDLKSFALFVERPKLYTQIEERVEMMIELGLVEEVTNLLASAIPEDAAPMTTIGYKEISRYLKGDLSLEEAITLMKKNTRNYAKRQMTWFKGHSEIEWLPFTTTKEQELAEVTILGVK